MSTIIKHPAGLTGSAVGLDFVDGTAKVSSLSKVARGILAEHGYKFEEAKDEPSEAEKAAAEKEAADKADAGKAEADAKAKADEAADAEKLAAATAAADSPKK